jgi:hypothetical protein
MGNDPEAVKLLLAKARAKECELSAERNRLTDRKKHYDVKKATEEQRNRIKVLDEQIDAALRLQMVCKSKL